MAEEKLLTKHDLLEALKNLATKDDVRQIMSEEIAARGLATKNDLAALEARTDDKLSAMETRFDGKLAAMEANITKELKDYVQQGVETVVKALDETTMGIKQQMVSKKEFAELKARVDARFPLN